MQRIVFVVLTVPAMMTSIGLCQELPQADVSARSSVSVPQEFQIDSLISRGQALARENEYLRALEVFADAVDLSRRHDGLSNETVIDVLELMALTALAGSEVSLANEYHREAQRIRWRLLEGQVRSAADTHGPDSRQHLDAMLALAAWLARQPDWVTPQELDDIHPPQWGIESRDIYKAALRLVRREFDDDPRLRVEVLLQMAGDSPGWIDEPDANSRPSLPRQLKQAERLLRRQDNPDPVLYATVMREIGDARIETNIARALEDYSKAWELLGQTEDADSMRQQFFGKPELVSRSNPYFFYNLPEASVQRRSGSVELEIQVDEPGQVRLLRVISADPEWAARAVGEMLQYSWFRPRFEAGEFIPAETRIDWEFQYNPDGQFSYPEIAQ